jgi:spermidine/putrescine transport system ATP-binding protein
LNGFSAGTRVKVKVYFNDIILLDNEEDGMLGGIVNFILYKGNHYHLTILTGENQRLFVDTSDIWDDGDRIGVNISPESIQIENL